MFRHLCIWNKVSLNVCSRCASFRWQRSNTSVISWEITISSHGQSAVWSVLPPGIWNCSCWYHSRPARTGPCSSWHCPDTWTPCLATSAPENPGISKERRGNSTDTTDMWLPTLQVHLTKSAYSMAWLARIVLTLRPSPRPSVQFKLLLWVDI